MTNATVTSFEEFKVQVKRKNQEINEHTKNAKEVLRLSTKTIEGINTKKMLKAKYETKTQRLLFILFYGHGRELKNSDRKLMSNYVQIEMRDKRTRLKVCAVCINAGI